MLKVKKRNLKKKTTKKSEVKPIMDTFPIIDITEEGVCLLHGQRYSRVVKMKDIDYRLSSEERQVEIFSMYCDFLNSLSNKVTVQLSIFKKKRSFKEMLKKLHYQNRKDSLDIYRKEMNEIIDGNLQKERNGFEKEIIYTFTTFSEDIGLAEEELEQALEQFRSYSEKIGAKVFNLNKQEIETRIAELFEDVSPESYSYPFPEKIDFKKNKRGIVFEHQFSQVSYLMQYPPELSDEFLSSLLEIPHELTVTFHIQSILPADAFDLVRTKLAFMEQQKVDEQKKAIKNGYDFEMLPYDLSYSLDEAKELVEQMQNNGQKLFSVTGCIYTKGQDQELQKKVKNESLSVCRRFGFQTIDLDYQQENGLNSVLPVGNNQLPVARTLLTTSTAIFMPFSIPELIHNNGKYYGINAISKNIISLDRKQLKAPNGFVLGTPGSGKSFSVKREIVNILLKEEEDEVIIIDPEREYSILGSAFDGEQVTISGDSMSFINPLDINENYGDDTDPVILKSEFLISLFDLIIGGTMGLSSTQKTIIDRVCRRTYEKIGNNPTLIDFYHLLKDQDEPEAAELVTDLEIYIEGSLSVFSKPTNVNVNKRFVIYDIKDLGKQLKTMGMLIVLDQVWNRITRNREKGIRTWLYIDEMQLLFSNEYSENYFFELWSRARKWGAIPTGITQNVETLLLSDLARRMLSNSDYVMMLNQAKTDRNQLIRLFDISSQQEKYITNSFEGHGLIVFGENIIPFYDKFPNDNQLYKMMSTKPGE